MRRPIRLSMCVAALAVLSASPAARAHGNYSHLWIAADAARHLEPGALADLLGRDGMLDAVRNGAMFPDGGYAMDDGYGEIAHWEPFHLEYLAWIAGRYAPPWPDEAARHIAFLLGMAAHGMADQLYDGMYLNRRGMYETDPVEEPIGGVDGVTDVCFAAARGPMERPPLWVPAAELVPLFGQLGHPVGPAVIEEGQSLVSLVISYASVSGQNQEIVAAYMADYPWSCANQDNPDIPGSPPSQWRAVAAYWVVLWDRLHGGDPADAPLLDIFFTGRSRWSRTVDAGSPASWVSFAMPFGLDPATLNADTVRVTDAAGLVHPVTIDLYYGRTSHLVNLKPGADWAALTDYTVTISPPLASWDGRPLAAPLSFGFSTRPEPEDPPETEPSDGGCSHARTAAWLPCLLLGLLSLRRRPLRG